MAPRIDPQDARQGRKGTPVLRILIIALVLAIVAGLGMWIFGRMGPQQTLPDASTGAGVTAPSPDASAPSGSTVTPQQSAPATGGNTGN